MHIDAWQTCVDVRALKDPGLEQRLERVLGNRGGSIGLGAKAMAEDFGQQFVLDLESDSSTAKGVGKIRHLYTPLLWLQRSVTNRKMLTWLESEADIGTKPLSRDVLDRS